LLIDFYHKLGESEVKLLKSMAIFWGFFFFILPSSIVAGIHVSCHPESFPPLIGFRVNEGNPYTNKTSVSVEIRSLKLLDSLVVNMKIGTDPNLEGTPWTRYSTAPQTIILSSGDGEKYIYARLRDVAGNISPIESVRIFLDTQAPSGVIISINKDDKYTRDEQRRVLVFIQTEDKDIAEMIFSNRRDFADARWEPFNPTKKWVLDMNGGDGEKSVFVKFRDEAGNESEIFTDQIILDTQPPVNGSVLINDDDKYTANREVTLKIRAEDATMVRIVSPGKSQMVEYQEKEGENFMEVNWRLDSAEGMKVVRVYFQDEANNRTTGIIQDEIILDRRGPPPPIISINGDEKYTNQKDGMVNLRFTSNVNPEAMKLMVSNYIDFHDAKSMTFRNVINNWALLADEDGIKTIYAKLIDEAGNSSEIGMSKVMLDRVPPEVKMITVNEGGGWAITPKITLNLEVEDASHMQISNTENIQNMTAWELFTPRKIDWPLIPGDGEKIVFMRFKDPAGNITPITSTRVILDTKPPKGELIIDGGARFTNDPDKRVTLSIRTDDGKGMQITNRPDFTDIKLEPVKDSLTNWTLEGEDGMKTVYLRLRDEAGNFSNVISSAIVLDRTPPGELSMIVNEGNEWVRNTARRTSVQLNASGASHFMLSEDPGFNGCEWESYKNVTNILLSENEGLKTLYVKFKDPAGNISEVISAPIKLDYTSPVCLEFAIDEDADFTNNTQKQVKLTIDAPDAVKMAISNTPILNPADISGQWEDYVESKDWILEGEDGLKTIYIVFQDEAGNISGVSSDRIILDRLAPTDCSVKINDNNKYVLPGGNKIPIEMTADGADKFIISEKEDFSDGRWELFIPKKVFEVSEGDGIKNLYIKFRDKAMNDTDVFSGTVILDTHSPEVLNVSVNGGREYINESSKKVKITIDAKEAAEMRISQKGHDIGDWEPFTSEKTITLMGEDGEKEIGIFLRDEAGNVAKPVVTTIILDRKPPRPDSFVIDDGRGWTNDPDKNVVLNFSVEDANEMMISTEPSFEGSIWENYQSTVRTFKLPGEDGEKVIFVKFRDHAGNVSPTISAKVNLKRSF
jgi:hypothetical protein